MPSNPAGLGMLAILEAAKGDPLEAVDTLQQALEASSGEEGVGSGEILSVGFSDTDPSLDKTELIAWTSVARVILNLHETITRY